MFNALRRSTRFPLQRLLLGILFSTMISMLAYRRRSLSRSGIAGAIVTGTTTFGLGGWPWGLSLIFFFISSSLLSHFRASAKAQTAADKFSKGGQRDMAQVAANGGIATLLALGYALTTSRFLQDLLRAGYAGALATATADTWATELGTLSSRTPRLITTGEPVAAGTSGGITLLGSGAGALGALTVGIVFWTLEGVAEGIDGVRRAATRAPSPHLLHARPYARSVCARGTRIARTSLPLLALISGLIGSFTDSLLGATWQVMYYCPACGKETERAVHSCGTRTHPLRGISWLNNDVVNFIATFCGALVAMGLQYVQEGLAILFEKQPPPPLRSFAKRSAQR